MIRRPMVRLVAEREIRERVRSKVFRISTAVLVVASLAAVLIPTLVGDDGPDRQTVALSGGPPGLGDALTAAAAAQGRALTVRTEDAADAERAGATGEVDAGVVVAGDGAAVRVVVEKELSDGLRAFIVQGLAGARVRAELAQAGVPPARIDELSRSPELTVRAVNPDDFQGGDLAVGYIVAVVLYMTLLFAGAVVASGVAEEKTSRVSEVLLASLRPSELLLGKVVGIGLTTLVQLAVAALPALIAALALDLAELPSSILPPFAPVMMPMRVATGGVPAGEMALALVLTVAAAIGAIALGARVYRGGITRTGPRMSLREALRPRLSAR
jgi:ABC-2 type transport system permease protein